ncbi:MAG: peptidyl-prolyl cis-trans isomerase [Candidatus Cloacimonetes bacterium]|nr:peptidyl-prolyl cis-trans isomerase [Candidatus Cloacimonadota bacterium]MBL7085500.1 peptidyl-prolyl cis-trans isomerase [Candidatus Cloacimonadota bacterium]
MISKKILIRTIIALLVSCIILGCLPREKTTDKSAILVEWDGGEITEQKLDKLLELIPEMYRPRGGYTVELKQKYLKDYGIEEIFYLEAKEKGIDNEQNVIDYYNKNAMQIVLQEYIKEKIKDKIKSKKSELKKFYEENKDKLFSKKPTATILYIQTTNADSANHALAELHDGVGFSEVVEKYSIHKFSKNKGGKITNVRQGEQISNIGKSPEIDSLIFSSELEEIVGPVKYNNTFHIFKVVEQDMSLYKPFEEVEKVVENRYKAQKENELKKELIENLIKKYNVTIDTTAIKNIDFAKADTSETEAAIQLIKSPVEEISFTVSDFANELKQMPSQRKQFLDNYEQRKKFLEDKTNNNVMYYDAIKRGYEKNPQIKDQLSRLQMIATLREYYKQYVIDSTIVTEQEIKEVYEQDKDKKYLKRASAKIQQFVFPDKETADYVFYKAKKTTTDQELNDLIEEYCINKAKNGIISKIYESGSIPGLGKDIIYVEKVFSTKEGDFSDVFKNMKGNYLFFKVLEYTPASYYEFETVSPEIERALTKNNQKKRFENLKEIMIAKYNLQVYPERLEKKLPLDSLYKYAETAMTEKNYANAINYYNQIIKYYNNSKDDYKATFMKGFIYSENLNDKIKAAKIFEEVLTYPEGDLHESAMYMLKAIQGEEDILKKINKATEEE